MDGVSDSVGVLYADSNAKSKSFMDVFVLYFTNIILYHLNNVHMYMSVNKIKDVSMHTVIVRMLIYYILVNKTSYKRST
jgi:hypothetical protein